MTKAIKEILRRHIDKDSKSYACMFACDDKKKLSKNYTQFYEITEDNLDKIVSEFYFYNTGSYGVYFNLNPLNSKNRGNEYVKRIKYIFIDIDEGANEEDYNAVKSFLEVKGFKIFYSCKSGSGYHILLNVDLDKKEQPKVKSFVEYLNINICSKIDLRTADLARICRVPESEHNKKKPFTLKTLILEEDKEENVKINNSLFTNFQNQHKEEQISFEYQESLFREDIFFSTLLNSQDKWQQYFKELNNHDNKNEGIGNNKTFNKNLALFCSKNRNYFDLAKQFMKAWGNKYVTLDRFESFYKKAIAGGLEGNVSYFELKKWAKEFNLKIFYEILKEQTELCYLDNYEVYYLEEEKKDLCYLLYFPHKNYYVQKSLPEILINIYRKSLEDGVDFEKQYNLKSLKDWEELSFRDKQKIIIGNIQSHLEKENRIKLVYNLNYAPLNVKFVYMDDKKYFNIYKKAKILDLTVNEINEYDFRHIKELILNLCENNETYYNWFISWLGYQIQFPNRKLPTAVIFQGEQGTGKGVLKTHILDPIFGKNCQEINQTHLESSFNEYLLGKQIIVANEVMHNENRQTLPNILKNLVTDEFITIQRKFRKDLVIRNYTHWIFCTNSDNPIKIEEGDRRYSVFKSKKLKGGGKSAMKFVNSLIDNKEHELPHFIHYLKKLSIDYFDVANPIITEAKEDIIELNKNSIDRFLEYIKTFPSLEKASLTLQNNKFVYNEDYNPNNEKVIVSEQFYLMYESFCDKFKERGMFNKISFGRKLSSLDLENKASYLSNRKSNARYFLLKDIENFMGVQEND